MSHERLNAVNTSDNPYEVQPRAGGETTLDGGKAESVLAPYSWNVIRFAVKK